MAAGATAKRSTSQRIRPSSQPQAGTMKKNASESTLRGSPKKYSPSPTTRAPSTPAMSNSRFPWPEDTLASPDEFMKALEDLAPAEVRHKRWEREKELYSELKEKTDAQTQLKVAVLQVNRLRARLESEKEQRRRVLDDIQFARQERRQLESKMSSFASTHGNMSYQLHIHATDKEVISKHHAGLHAEKVALESLSEARSLRQKMATVKEEVVKLRKEFKAADIDVEHLAADLKKEEAELARLNGRLDVAKHEQSRLTEKAAEKTLKARRLSTEIAQLEGDHWSLQSSIKAALLDLRATELKYARLQTQKKQWTERIQGLKKHTAALGDATAQAEHCRQELDGHVDMLAEGIQNRIGSSVAMAESEASPMPPSPKNPGRGNAARRPGAQPKNVGKARSASPTSAKRATGTQTEDCVTGAVCRTWHGEASVVEGETRVIAGDRVTCHHRQSRHLALAGATVSVGTSRRGKEATVGKARRNKVAQEQDEELHQLQKLKDRIAALEAENARLKVACAGSPAKPDINLLENPFKLFTVRQFIDGEGMPWELESADSEAPLYEGTADLSHVFGGAKNHAKNSDNPYKLYKDKVFTDDEGMEWDLEPCDSEQGSYKGEGVDLSHLFVGRKGHAAGEVQANECNWFQDKTYTDGEGRGHAAGELQANQFNWFQDKTYTDDEDVEWDLEPCDSEQGSFKLEDVDLSHLLGGQKGQAEESPRQNAYSLYTDKTYIDNQGVEWELEPCDSEQESYTGESMDLSHLCGRQQGLTTNDGENNALMMSAEPTLEAETVDKDLERPPSERSLGASDANLLDLEPRAVQDRKGSTASLVPDLSLEADDGEEVALQKCDPEKFTFRDDADVSHLKPQTADGGDKNALRLYIDPTREDDDGVEGALKKCGSEKSSYQGDADPAHLTPKDS